MMKSLIDLLAENERLKNLRRKISGVYLILNTVNSKVYVGQSVDVKIRYIAHLSALRIGTTKKSNPYLQRSFDLYGESAFDFVLLERCERNKFLLNSLERFWIDYFNSANSLYGYNLIAYSESLLGEYSELSKEKMRQAKLGKSMPNETREKIRAANRGRRLASYASLGLPMPEEVRQKVSQSRKGKYLGARDPAIGVKISHSLTGKKLSQEHVQSLINSHIKDGYIFNKRVVQMDLDGNEIAEFFSMSEAARLIGTCKPSNISKCIAGVQKTAGGYKWKLVE